MDTIVQINNSKIPLTNLDKIFWPESGYTKADIMNYYTAVWPYLEPHLKDRPVSLVRYPDGITGNYFYQKNVLHPPEWVETLPIKSDDRLVNYVMINNLETLIWTINLGCIEIHPWLSTKTDLHHPTYLIFDLDPMEPANFSDTVKIANFIRMILNELKLAAFPKVSGATGIHIYLPLKQIYSFKQTSKFVKKIGELIIKTFPSLATNERKVTKRSGKVYIDHLQNLHGKTIASVYSLRPFPEAPVSMPVSWNELSDCHPSMFNITNAVQLLKQRGDLFKDLLVLKQILPDEFL